MYRVYFPYDEDRYTDLEMIRVNGFINLINDKLIKFACNFYSISMCQNHELYIKIHREPFYAVTDCVHGTFSGKNIKRPEINIFGVGYRSFSDLTKTFFHEFTHYKQWAYDNEMLDKTNYNIKYRERPEEIEAWQNQEIMFDHMINYLKNYMNLPVENVLT